ncbi:MAG: 50S ribosomal protein L1 [Dehalococcoidia bacterium]|nr:50S ribosomal protein L1 [Dehalococcoidia bacterium]
MVKTSKRYQGVVALVDRDHAYEPAAAISLAKKTATAKFDETVELHIRTGADPRQADQLIREVALLPNGLGKPVRVLVFTQGDAARAAREAGADYVGDDDLIQQIEGGWVEFDTSIATPDMMGRIGRLGRVLGRRGLMPNPRTGTVVQAQDIPRAVADARKGRVEIRMDRTSIIHAPIGKASFSEQALLENLTAVVELIVRARPATVKGQFIRSAYLTAAMGPGIPMDLSSLLDLRVE